LYYAMAKDGLFFKRATHLNKFSVPSFALWTQCVWACLLCFSGTYHQLISYATFASLLFYIVTIAGLFILRNREPDAPRPYKVFGYPFLPALYILAATAICVDLVFMDFWNTIGALIVVGVGVIVYFIQNALSEG
jgi:APA family basic amino acid/polyamine antiporter